MFEISIPVKQMSLRELLGGVAGVVATVLLLLTQIGRVWISACLGDIFHQTCVCGVQTNHF